MHQTGITHPKMHYRERMFVHGIVCRTSVEKFYTNKGSGLNKETTCCYAEFGFEKTIVGNCIARTQGLCIMVASFIKKKWVSQSHETTTQVNSAL